MANSDNKWFIFFGVGGGGLKKGEEINPIWDWSDPVQTRKKNRIRIKPVRNTGSFIKIWSLL